MTTTQDLIARLEQCNPPDRTIDEQRPVAELIIQAAARLRELTEMERRTRKQWCGRDYDHLPLDEAVGAATQAREKQAEDRCAEQEAEIARLSAALVEASADAASWEQQNDDRVSDVLEQASRAEKAEAEIVRLVAEDAYNTDIIARFAEKLGKAEAERDNLDALLKECIVSDEHHVKERDDLIHDNAQYVQRDTGRLAEVEALQQDAERYRWLRGHMFFTKREWRTYAEFPESMIFAVPVSAENKKQNDAIDAAIDAARARLEE
jgi:hypothetical protein